MLALVGGTHPVILALFVANPLPYWRIIDKANSLSGILTQIVPLDCSNNEDNTCLLFKINVNGPGINAAITFLSDSKEISA